MEIIPYYGQERLSASSVIIQVNPQDRQRAQHLLAEASEVALVKDEETFALAKHMAGRLRAMMNEIELGKKATKQPFDAVINAISETALEVGDPVVQEHKRILGLLNAYVAELEAARKEQERKAAAESQRIADEHDRRIREALEAQAKAEREAREAKDETAREKARADAQARMLVAAQEQLAKEIAAEVASLGQEPRKGLVVGGRVDHSYEFQLTDIAKVISAGALRLLRWEVDHYACRDACREQLEKNPGTEPTLPGIQVTRRINVSVKARS